MLKNNSKSTINYKLSQVRVRIAPSPTGPLHLGTVKTALFNYLYAQQHQGQFILRIEDTDKERSQEKFIKDIVDNLKWLGLDWDEGPFCQSQRLALYKGYLQKLLHCGQAFYCYHSKEELEAEKNEQMAAGLAPKHVCSHFGQKPNANKKGIIRFRCPAEKISFKDLIRGKLTFDGALLGDISIAKDQDTPLYQIAAVVDDAEMKISHVIRGEDHISNTPKQIFIQQALGLPTPEYAHLPLILGPDKTKLSKRHGAVSMGWYKERGYLPEAMNNFAAFLGWNPGTAKEIFSLTELIKEFSLERVQKGGAIFNINRLDWLNGYYIRKTDLTKLTRLCLPYLIKDKLIEPDGKQDPQKQICPPKKKKQTKISLEVYKVVATGQTLDFDCLKQIVALEQDRMKKISEIGRLTKYFFVAQLDYQARLLCWKETSLNKTKEGLELTLKILSKAPKFDQKSLEDTLMPQAQQYGIGALLWPLRVALSGLRASPGPFEIAAILGQERTLERIKQALDKLT